MLYMAASMDERTEQAAIRDLEELERVTRENPKVNEHVNLLVRSIAGGPATQSVTASRTVGANCVHIRCIDRETSKPDPNESSGNPGTASLSGGDRTEQSTQHYLLCPVGTSYGLGFGRDHGIR